MATITSLANNSSSTYPNDSNVKVYATSDTPMRLTLGAGEEVTIEELNDGNPITTTPFDFTYNASSFPSGLTPIVNNVDPSFDKTLNSFQLMASEVYSAWDSVKEGTENTTAQSGDIISIIRGGKGVRDMPYVGVETPTLGRPYLNTTSQIPFVPFKNQPFAFFMVDLYDSEGQRQYYYYDEGGYACTFIMQLMPGQSSEAWMNDYGCRNYMGELNGLLRVGTEEKYRVPNDSMPTEFEYCVLHVEYKKPNIEVWKNGEYVGSVENDFPEHTGNYGDLGKLRDVIGVLTNMANINFIQCLQWYTPQMANLIANRTAILNSFNTKFYAGEVETRPYAKSLTTTYNGTDRWTVAFTAMNATSDQIAATTYQWRLRLVNDNEGEGGSFSPQIVVGQNRNFLLKSEIQSYIDDESAIFLNCLVEVGGTGTWTTCASPYNSNGLS